MCCHHRFPIGYLYLVKEIWGIYSILKSLNDFLAVELMP